MAQIDNGEEKLERVTSEAARAGTRAALRFAVDRVENLTEAMVERGLRMASAGARWAMTAVRKPGGETSVKELSELPSRTGREVVSVDGVKSKKTETTPAVKRSDAETVQMQKELRAKVEARAGAIRAAAPPQAPKLSVPSPGVKR